MWFAVAIHCNWFTHMHLHQPCFICNKYCDQTYRVAKYIHTHIQTYIVIVNQTKHITCLIYVDISAKPIIFHTHTHTHTGFLEGFNLHVPSWQLDQLIKTNYLAWRRSNSSKMKEILKLADDHKCCQRTVSSWLLRLFLEVLLWKIAILASSLTLNHFTLEKGPPGWISLL